MPVARWSFSARSLGNLAGVSLPLVKVLDAAIDDSPYDFGITEGVRSPERQRELFDAGKSKTMNSRHLTGDAVDIVVYVHGQVTWDIFYYEAVARHIKFHAAQQGVAIEWGGDWASFVDGPHFQLAR